MNKYRIIFFLVSIFGCSSMAVPQDKFSLKVLQLNVWMHGSNIKNGVDAVAGIILQADADLITLSEVNPDFMDSLTSVLKTKGGEYASISSNDCGVVSKFPILEQDYIYSPDKGHNGILKTTVRVNENKLSLYSVHLDYLHYGAFLPRGYDGQTWKKLPHFITDKDRVLTFNDASMRDEQTDVLIKDANKEIAKGNIVIMGGDFNEPSHLDWIFSTRQMYDHHGAVIPWTCTRMLENAGFTDAYREIYPNPLTNPGFTWPSDNTSVSIDQLVWAPEADSRDRIDFIFYSGKQKNLALNSITILGPQASVIRDKRVPEKTNDPILAHKGDWPSDHKGLSATFELE